MFSRLTNSLKDGMAGDKTGDQISDQSREIKDIPRINQNPFKKSYTYRFPCKICGRVLKKKITWRNHMSKHKNQENSSKEPWKIATHKSQYKYALIIIDGKEYYHCDKCGKNLGNHHTFRKHLGVHTDEKPFNCDSCERKFRTAALLSRHVDAVHKKIKNCVCELCGRGFNEKRVLENHRRIHTGERPFVCETCGKSFSDPSSLYTHKKIHNKNYTLSCNICNKFFPCKPHLERHLRYHKGEKPFPCDVCHKKFRDKQDVRRHRIIHYDMTVYTCQLCNSQYKALRSLKKHEKRFHSSGK